MYKYNVISTWTVSATESALFRCFDAWDYIQDINWSEVGMKALKGYIMFVAGACFMVLHLGLLAYATGKWVWVWVWENREAIAATAKEAWGSLEPKFEESDAYIYILSHSDIELSPIDEFKAEMDARLEQEIPLGMIPSFQLA